MNFAQWLENDKDELIKQAEDDMRLHMRAIHQDRYSFSQDRMLAEDIPWKQKFIDLLRKQSYEPKDIRLAEELIKRIQRDKNSHKSYLNTEDRAWHLKWMARYDRWIAELEKIISNGADKAQLQHI